MKQVALSPAQWDRIVALYQSSEVKVNRNPGQVTFAELNNPGKLLLHEVAPDFPVTSDHEILDWIGE